MFMLRNNPYRPIWMQGEDFIDPTIITKKETRPMSNNVYQESWMDGYCNNIFDTKDKAITSATKHAQYYKTDVTIWRSVAIARYPFPAITIEEIPPTVSETTSS